MRKRLSETLLRGITKLLPKKMVPKRLRDVSEMVEIEIDISDDNYTELVLNAEREGITVDELVARIVSNFIKAHYPNE